ncbi:MAG: amidohydrolase family protein [Flavobacteriales bacterium]
MQYRIISADEIYTLNGSPIQSGFVVLDKEGKIRDVVEHHAFEGEPSQVEYFNGVISPGFVNAHCHLELSGWKDKIGRGLGLDAFINGIYQGYKEKWSYDLDAMQLADQAMYEKGIVAVADISNTSHSFIVKANSHVHYHTFAEVFAFSPDKAERAFQKGMELLDAANAHNLQASISPHAPYSLSKPLMQLIAKQLEQPGSLLSIHHQESEAENEMFLHRKGTMVERLKSYGFLMNEWTCPHDYPVAWFMPAFKKVSRILLVHNTFTNAESVKLAQSLHQNPFWCLCPNANLYIEKRLPDIIMLKEHKLNICIGTDSLASNDSLSIADEILTIRRHFPQIAFNDILHWACLNGARFLGIDHRFGSIERGKQPGLVHWPNPINDDIANIEKIKVKRIA